MINAVSIITSSSIGDTNNNILSSTNNDAYSNRESNDRHDTFSITAKTCELSSENIKNTSDININIYRYKFTQEFMDKLYIFSKIHQYDHRKDFKEAWAIWVEENNEIICDEVRRLTNLGYDGNILDKMFKSARYYFRKKTIEKKEPQQRREYIGVQKELLDSMDQHILSNIKNDNYKPSEGFDDYCKEYIDILKDEVTRLCKSGIINSVEMKNKIKKTYKNRYFILVTK